MSKLDFKDYITVDYKPGEDDQTKYRAVKRKRADVEEENTDEALNMAQRRAAARRFARMKTKIKIGRDRAKKRIADPARLKKRARKQARNQILKKLMKGQDKSDLSFARRQEIEKRLDKPAMKSKIDRLAKKLLPKARRAELDRKRGGQSTK